MQPSVVEHKPELFDKQHIIPISTPKEVESLSAILLDDEYFELIQSHSIFKDGIYLINERALIPFKAKAYLEIKERKEIQNIGRSIGEISSISL
jgi:hypothetical protein